MWRRVGVSDPARDGLHGGEARRVGFPILIVVAVQPNDVVEPVITVSEILTVGVGIVDAEVRHVVEPVLSLCRVEQDHDSVFRREPEHLVDAGEILLVRLIQIVIFSEGMNPVPGARVRAPPGAYCAEQVDHTRR
jgi:hypothetical protein